MKPLVARLLRAVALLILLAALPQTGRGQASVLEHFNPISSKTAGVHLYGATISSAYFPNSYGVGAFGVGTPTPGFGGSAGAGTDSPVTVLQGSAVLGWSMPGETSSVSIVYSPAYVRALNQSNYSSLNHSLSISASKTLTSKWTLGASANGLVSDFSQLLFARTQYGNISATPATFDEFVAGILTGKSTNTTLTQVINAAPVTNSPETAFLYGDRLLSTAASLSVSYAYSSRSSLSFSIGANRTQQFRSGSSDPINTPTLAVPKTSAGSGSVGWSYSLTPRTTTSVNVASTRTFSSFQDAYATQASVSIGRTMSRRWFVHAMAGVGVITPLRTTFAPSQNAQQIFGGSVGYKVYAHTLLASYTRSISDVYGLGANASETSAGAWTWKRPGRSVSVSGSFGYSRLVSPLFPNSRSWTAHGGVGKALSAHVVLSVAASYMQYPRSILAATSNLAQTGVIATLSWSPSVRQ